jgi:hypothetical protein
LFQNVDDTQLDPAHEERIVASCRGYADNTTQSGHSTRRVTPS